MLARSLLRPLSALPFALLALPAQTQTVPEVIAKNVGGVRTVFELLRTPIKP